MATRTLLLLLLCCGLFSSPAQAQCLVLNASSNAEYPPYLWRANADDSHLQGALALMLNSIGKSANIKIHSTCLSPSDTLVSGRTTRGPDVVSGQPITP